MLLAFTVSLKTATLSSLCWSFVTTEYVVSHSYDLFEFFIVDPLFFFFNLESHGVAQKKESNY